MHQLIDKISKHSGFIISTHKYCDGDGLGSGLALYYILQKLNKKVSFLTLESPHKKYKFLDQGQIFKTFDSTHFPYNNNTLLLVVDTNDPLLVEPLYSHTKKYNMQTCFIDHHPIIHNKQADHFFINSESSSTAEIIYELLIKMNLPIDEKIATSLFTSIVFDTNQFKNIKKSSNPFEVSAKILPYIKNINIIYDNLFRNLTIDDLQFFTQIQNIEYYYNKKVALLYLTQDKIDKANVDITQAFNLMDVVKDVSSIKSTVLLFKNKDHSFKLSLRSKSINLLPLIKQFNGGGHRYSAGAHIKNQKLSEIKKIVLDYLKN